MSGKTFEVTSENFDAEVLNAPLPVLINFWADWSPPCRAITPLIDELAAEYEGKLRVGKLDTTIHTDLTYRYTMMALPTLIIFKDGEPAVVMVGVQPKEKIVELITKTLNEVAP